MLIVPIHKLFLPPSHIVSSGEWLFQPIIYTLCSIKLLEVSLHNTFRRTKISEQPCYTANISNFATPYNISPKQTKKSCPTGKSKIFVKTCHLVSHLSALMVWFACPRCRSNKKYTSWSFLPTIQANKEAFQNLLYQLKVSCFFFCFFKHVMEMKQIQLDFSQLDSLLAKYILNDKKIQ